MNDERKKPTELIVRPKSPGVTMTNGNAYSPAEYDPEMANLAIAKLLIQQQGKLGRVSKAFIVREGLFTALNHVPKVNETGYDCSLRLQAYEHVLTGSNNIDGFMTEKIWAFLMKPKYIINGMSGIPGTFEEEKGESLIGRAINWFRGGKKQDAT